MIHARTCCLPRLYRLALAFLLVLAAGTVKADPLILDFSDFVPGSVITSQVSGDFLITVPEVPPSFPIALEIEVNPGAPGCNSIPCAYSGSTSLWTQGNYPVQIERVDGGTFTPLSVELAAGPGTYCVYDGVTEGGAQLGNLFITCSTTGFATAAISDHGPLRSFVIWSIGGWLGVDDLIVDVPAPPPPPPPVPANVTLTSDARRVSASGTDEIWDEYGEVIGCSAIESDSETPVADFADFTGSAAAGSGGWANQSTTVSTTGFSGSGSASGYSDYCWGFGYSIFRVGFHVDTPVRVHFSGDLSASGYTLAQARLQKDEANVFLAETWDAPLPFDHQSVLLPGDYTLTMQADGGNAWVDSSFDFAVSFEETPALVPALGPAAQVILVALMAGVPLVNARVGRPERRSDVDPSCVHGHSGH